MPSAAIDNRGEGFSAKFQGAGFALGFGLGGFFDGILLHQVLQWHHLLSGLASAKQDIRILILADGLFHVLMYLITSGGLWLLWRARHEVPAKGAGSRLLRAAAIGFGMWHVTDSILSHWILGIHRVRMDVENPLVWDLLWFVMFGLVPLALGWFWRGGSGKKGHGAKAASVLLLAVLVAGPIAALPAPGQTARLVFFGSGTSPAQAAQAVAAAEGRIVWIDPSGQLWAVELPPQANAASLYRNGALLVSGSALAAGCLNWIKI